MKKIISILTVLTIIFTLPFVASALTPEEPCLYNDPRLDLTQYTLDDLRAMSINELSDMVAEFERVYDPYGSYARRMEANEEAGISPRWTSGGEDDDATHTGITAQACLVLSNDKGFFTNGIADTVTAIMLISLCSNLPDDDETDNGTFVGHFYDPSTEENYLGNTANTAKTNAVAHYQNAYEAAGAGDIMKMYEELGRALHYVQDANVPYHASNVISLGPTTDHYKFEKFAEENLLTYIDDLTSLASSNYTTLANEYVRDLVKMGAEDAKDRYPNLDNSEPESDEWDTVARFCTRKSVKYSAIIMYKLGQRSEVPFHYNLKELILWMNDITK